MTGCEVWGRGVVARRGCLGDRIHNAKKSKTAFCIAIEKEKKRLNILA